MVLVVVVEVALLQGRSPHHRGGILLALFVLALFPWLPEVVVAAFRRRAGSPRRGPRSLGRALCWAELVAPKSASERGVVPFSFFFEGYINNRDSAATVPFEDFFVLIIHPP